MDTSPSECIASSADISRLQTSSAPKSAATQPHDRLLKTFFNKSNTPSRTSSAATTRQSQTDSGYNTQQSDRAEAYHSVHRSRFSISNLLQRTPLPATPRFQRLPSQQELDRYRDLWHLLGSQLVDVVNNTQEQCLPCTAKLRFYGITERNSKPCIVVLCDKSIARKVRRLLSKPVNRDQIYARDDDFVPPFDALVEERPAKRFTDGESASLEVSIYRRDLQFKLGGARLRLSADGNTVIATLGGILEIQEDLQHFYYGLTVAHMITGPDVVSGSVSQSACDCLIDENSSYCSGDQSQPPSDSDSLGEKTCYRCRAMEMPCSFDKKGATEKDCLQCRTDGTSCASVASHRGSKRAAHACSEDELNEREAKRTRTFDGSRIKASPGRSRETLPQSSPSEHCDDSDAEAESLLWKRFGRLFSAGQVMNGSKSLARTSEPNLDWALIQLYDQTLLKPNEHSGPPTQWESVSITKTYTMPPSSMVHSTMIRVTLILGDRKYCTGILCPTPAFVLLPPSNNFATVYTMRIEGGQVLERGDCGAWVLEEDSRHVIGVVCARDDDEDIYVIPMGHILDQIKQFLQVKHVSIPEIISTRYDHQEVSLPSPPSAAEGEEVVDPIKAIKAKGFAEDIGAQERVTGAEDEEFPLYVNAKQFHRILKRRVARQKVRELLLLSGKGGQGLHGSEQKYGLYTPQTSLNPSEGDPTMTQK